MANNSTGTVPNAPIACAPGKDLRPPKSRVIEIHGGQIKRERDRYQKDKKIFHFYQYYVLNTINLMRYNTGLR